MIKWGHLGCCFTSKMTPRIYVFCKALSGKLANLCQAVPTAQMCMVWVLLTRIMCPVEISMLDCTGSSHQDGVLLWELGLAWGASLNCEETLLTREFSAGAGGGGVSARPKSDLAAMCCRQSSCGKMTQLQHPGTLVTETRQKIGKAESWTEAKSIPINQRSLILPLRDAKAVGK